METEAESDSVQRGIQFWCDSCQKFPDGYYVGPAEECNCPICGEPDFLTPADVAQGYQCDRCADQAERGGY